MIHRLAPFAALACLGAAFAQEREPEAGLVALHQACLDAGTDAVVLNVAAHPDDESSRTNTMLRRKFGWRVVTVYSTYGDGGQNAIGREIGPELASLRVRETLRAAAMMDVEVRWLGMPDFGFSKTLDETLQVWGGDLLKERMRAVLDAVQPDLVITNHSLTQGHGHHRASYWAVTEILQERHAAGGHVPPLYARCSLEKAHVTFDPAELEPARGETYARLAHRAWTQHVTQGPWGAHNPLQVGKDYWQLVAPELVLAPAVAADPAAVAAAAGDFGRWVRRKDDGLERLPADAARLPRAELHAQVARRLREAQQRWQAAMSPAGRAAPAERDGRGQVGGRTRLEALRVRIDALERAWLALHAVRTEVWLERDEVPLGGQGKAYAVVHGHERTQGLEVLCDGAPAEPAQVAVRATPFDGLPAPPANAGAAPPPAAAAAPIPSATPTPPPAPAPGRYVGTFSPALAADDAALQSPEPQFVGVLLRFQVEDVPIKRLVSLHYTPVEPVEVRWDREVVMVPRGQRVERLLSASVTSHRDGDLSAAVRLSMGPGITASATPGRLQLSKEHDEARLLVRAAIDGEDLTADAGLELGFRDAAARLPVRVVDVSVPPGLHVGLVRGPDDTTERALADLGVRFTALDRDALLTARFEDFTTVLLDIRAYHHRPELAEVRERLLQFCRAGGRIVAMYHKPNEWNERAGHPLLAPFPMTVGDGRVTEEDAAVALLQPTHRLLRHPHPLEAADFAGWVQERGLNFPTTWDPAWTPLLEMKDRGDEKPLQGALLHTQYGRGDFVYCSLALYRQLRVGNPGAARLLVNLLAP